MKFWNWLLGIAPSIRSTTWPSLNRMKVGMLDTRNCIASFCSASTSSLAIRTLPSISLASSSSSGATMRHGPHHSAQKSTRTGVCEFSTSFWKFSPVTCTIFSFMESTPFVESSSIRSRPCLGLALHNPKTPSNILAQSPAHFLEISLQKRAEMALRLRTQGPIDHLTAPKQDEGRKARHTVAQGDGLVRLGVELG